MRTSRDIAALSFDFFNTLATHRHDRGRGALVMEYFRAQGWESDSWAHAALYDVFAIHGGEYAPTMSGAELKVFAARVARTLFDRLHVRVDHSAADAHGLELWRILGPDHLVPFPEVTSVLTELRAAGYGLAVISNWQHGLRAFCQALGFGAQLDAVVASAEVGVAKPDARIFAEACHRLSLPPERVLHVGDTEADDVVGARSAGLHALWLRREAEGAPSPGEIRSLSDVPGSLASARDAVGRSGSTDPYPNVR